MSLFLQNNDMMQLFERILAAKILNPAPLPTTPGVHPIITQAMRLHSDGYTTAHPALCTCWDADRLDLGRVGITPQAGPQALTASQKRYKIQP